MPQGYIFSWLAGENAEITVCLGQLRWKAKWHWLVAASPTARWLPANECDNNARSRQYTASSLIMPHHLTCFVS
jgi:hypothetical protein